VFIGTKIKALTNFHVVPTWESHEYEEFANMTEHDFASHYLMNIDNVDLPEDIPRISYNGVLNMI